MVLIKYKMVKLSVIVLMLLWFTPFQVLSGNLDAQNVFKSIPFSPGIKLISDVVYGEDNKNKMDVYLPAQAKDAPVIFMVHGGAWAIGDKANKQVVENKVSLWVPKGFIFISTNYRLLPTADPLKQVLDVAKALAFAQEKAPLWGGDPSKFVLMGHSAGAHLVAVLAASPSIAYDLGAKPWLGVILIDSAALNLVEVMERRHHRLYDKAFGSNAAYFKSVSPYHLLETAQAPFLAICSTRRKYSCSQAIKFVNKALSLDMSAKVLKINMSHKDTNELLGKDRIYTEEVEAFLATLDKSIMQALTKP